jgi:DNA cross-link repair 1A protein
MCIIQPLVFNTSVVKMEEDFGNSSDFLELIEALEKEEVVSVSGSVPVAEKENFLIAGIKRAARQLSIRDFFKGPKRKLVQCGSVAEEGGDEDNEDNEDKVLSIPVFKQSKEVLSHSGKSKAAQATPQVAQTRPVKTIPSFKWIPESKFVVDAFNYGLVPGAQAYFLTHFHSDHYRGLNGRFWQSAPEQVKMYCSPATANLVAKELRVAEDRIVRLQVGLLYTISEEWKVGVLDANHCPGSVMFIFCDCRRGKKWHLHTGDFRFHPGLLEGAVVRDAQDGTEFAVSQLLFDHLFLDTTYARPDYAFPCQDAVIAACISGCQSLLTLKPKKWCIAVGSYLIGKERIILALADFFDSRIYADARKRAILTALNWPELTRRLTDDPNATPFHIVSMALLSKQKLNDYRGTFKGRFTHILGIRPTGWSFSKNGGDAAVGMALPAIDYLATVWSVPYSEHSSYAELAQFLRGVAFRRVVPTVDNSRGIGHDVAKCNYNTDLLLKIISNK